MYQRLRTVYPVLLLSALLAAYVLSPGGRVSGALKGTAPTVVIHVSPNGNDNTGDGTTANPYRTIQFALDQAGQSASAQNEVMVKAAAGTYAEAPVAPPFVSLAGANAGDPAATIIQPNQGVIAPLEGVVVLQEGSRLLDLTVRPPLDVDPNVLVEIDCADARVDNVVLDGLFEPFTTGIRAIGPASDDSTITRCLITQMDIGVESVSSRVIITRNTFDSISVAGVRSLPGCEGNQTPRLGDDANAATTGFNQMQNMGGALVSLPGRGNINAELNDWGVYDEAAIADGMDIDPGPSIIVPTLIVVIVDERSGEPIANGSIRVEPQGLIVSDNVDGIYVVPAIAPGSYTVCVHAPGYLSTQVQASLSVGITVLNVELLAGCEVKTLPLEEHDKGGAAATVDFEPFLAQGQLAVQPTVLVTVRNGADGTLVTTASVGMQPGLFDVRAQVNGVYTIPIVTPGNYTVTASAEGVGTGSQNVTIREGSAVVEVVVTLGEEPDEGGCG